MLLPARTDQANIEQTLAAWKHFVASGNLDEAMLRPHVARAWKRCRAAGCHPRWPGAVRLSDQDTLALLDKEQSLIAMARPFLVALSRAVGKEQHAAVLTDPSACVLDVVADEWSLAQPGLVPGPGVVLAEAAVGANGLGTPLAEGTYVELVGPEHYVEAFHDYTCQGIPLRDGRGEIVGVLGLSVRRLETAERVRDVLFCASQGIECEILSRRLLDQVATAVSPGGPVMAERLRQDITQRLAAARLNLEAAVSRMARGGDAASLLAAAKTLVQRFQRQAMIWRDLVCDEASAPEPVSVGELVHDLFDLLATEAGTSGISLGRGCEDAVIAVVDRRALARDLLGKLLTALQHAGRGGWVRVDVVAGPGDAMGAIRVSAASPAGESVVEDQTLIERSA